MNTSSLFRKTICVFILTSFAIVNVTNAASPAETIVNITQNNVQDYTTYIKWINWIAGKASDYFSIVEKFCNQFKGACKETTVKDTALSGKIAGNVQTLSSLAMLNINIQNFSKDAGTYAHNWNKSMSAYQDAKVRSYKYIISAIDKNPSWKLDADTKKKYIASQVPSFQATCNAQKIYDQKLNSLINGLNDTYYTSIIANGASFFRKYLPPSFSPLDTFRGLEKEVYFGMSFTCDSSIPENSNVPNSNVSKRLSGDLDQYIEGIRDFMKVAKQNPNKKDMIKSKFASLLKVNSISGYDYRASNGVVKTFRRTDAYTIAHAFKSFMKDAGQNETDFNRSYLTNLDDSIFGNCDKKKAPCYPQESFFY